MLSKNRPSKSTKNREKLLRDVTETNKTVCRLNAEIEDSLYKKIKMRAVEEDSSISELTRQLWVEYLSK